MVRCRLLALFLSAVALGVAYCAPPGVVTVESLRRGLGGGLAPVLRVQLGSLIGDALWAVVALAGAGALVMSRTGPLVVGGIGVIVLARLAWDALTSAGTGHLPDPADLHRGSFTTGAVLSLTNPWAIAFWLGIAGMLATANDARPTPLYHALFLGGFMTGAIVWALAISLLITWGRQYVGSRFFRWVNLVAACGLAFFGVQLLLDIV